MFSESESKPSKRAFTRLELQVLFDYADEQVARKRALGRKGWLSAFRDATIFKVAYGYGTGVTRPGCGTSLTSAATLTGKSSVTTGSVTSAMAKQDLGRSPNGAVC
jgi:hypothetical protein